MLQTYSSVFFVFLSKDESFCYPQFFIEKLNIARSATNSKFVIPNL